MDLHVADEIVRDNIVNMGEVINLFDQVSLDKSLDPPDSLTQNGIIASLERVLLATMEEVAVPEGYVGLIMLRSTVARAGLVAPVTYADAGFYGTLTMEVFNSNKWGIHLIPGTHLWNMVIVPAPYEEIYQGRYQGQGFGVNKPKALSFEKDLYVPRPLEEEEREWLEADLGEWDQYLDNEQKV
jgi:deoxycytidine triphosphate deaminase